MEMLTKFSGLIAHASEAELDCIFPINRETEAVKIRRIRGMITSATQAGGFLWWYFGFTKDPKSYPTSSIDFWFDEATWGRLQEAMVNTTNGINYAYVDVALPQVAELDIVAPYRLTGVWFNQLGDPRRFILEIYYEVVTVGRIEAQILWRKFNKRV